MTKAKISLHISTASGSCDIHHIAINQTTYDTTTGSLLISYIESVTFYVPRSY